MRWCLLHNIHDWPCDQLVAQQNKIPVDRLGGRLNELGVHMTNVRVLASYGIQKRWASTATEFKDRR